MTEAVIVSNVIVIASLVSQIVLLANRVRHTYTAAYRTHRHTDTHRGVPHTQTHRHTHTHTVTHTHTHRDTHTLNSDRLHTVQQLTVDCMTDTGLGPRRFTHSWVQGHCLVSGAGCVSGSGELWI